MARLSQFLTILLLGLSQVVVQVQSRKSFHEIQLENEIEKMNRELGMSGEDVLVKDVDEAQAQAQAQANPNDNGRASSAAAVPVVWAARVDLPINHFGDSPAPGTFQNRYWVLDEFWKPGGPVFTFDTGEAEDGSAYLGYLRSNASFFNQYLQEFGGLGVLWEHRYYGQSTPYPINLETTAEQLQYLTTEQALKDFDVFANQFSWKLGGPDSTGEAIDFSPKKHPWVHVGGSYPGMRAAMLRDKFPQTVFAAYASSAPVQAQHDMRVYWEQVYRGMVKYGYENCTVNIRSAIDYIDKEMGRSKQSSAAIKIKFLGKTADKNSNEGFADTLVFPLYAWQGQGVDATIQEFCKVLEFGSANPAEPTTGGGISEDTTTTGSKRGKLLAERWANWPGFVELVNLYNPQGICEGPVPLFGGNLEPNCLLDARFEGILSTSWTWQYCTEWGFLQANNDGKGMHPLGSRFNTIRHQEEICYRQFPDGLSSGYLPRRPDTRRTNKKFGGWFMRPSNTFWTAGQYDPWKTLSPQSEESFAPGFKATSVIPQCNVKTALNQPIFGYELENAQHCDDFSNPLTFPAAKVPQKLFADALREWLKCFVPK